MGDERLGRAVLELSTETVAFFREMQKAERSATGLDKTFDKTRESAKTLGRDLSRAVAGFSGEKLVAEATTMAHAVQRVGGVSALTKTELDKVTATVHAATAKLKAMGVEVPPAIRLVSAQLTDMGRGAETSGGFLSGLGGIAGKLGPLLPIASVAGLGAGLVSLGKRAFDAAGETLDLANSTGLSTDAIQEMQFVANQTGTSVDAFTSSTFKLGVTVAEGSKKARDAIKDLGLSYADLKAQRPEDQFATVVKALEDVDNQQERNRIGTALFGKQFSEIAASIQEGYSDIAAGAGKSSRAQLEALDSAGDAWAEFVNDVQKEVQRALGSMVLLAKGLPGSLQQLNAEEEILVATLRAQGATVADIAEALTNYKRRTDDVALSSGAAASAHRDFVKELAAVEAKLNALAPAARAQIDAAIELDGVSQQLADQFGLTEEELRMYQRAVKDTAQDVKEASNWQLQWAASQKQWQEEQKKSLLDAEKFNAKMFTAPAALIGATDALMKASDAALVRNLSKRVGYERDLDTLIKSRTMTRLNFEIDQIEKWAAAEKRGLDKSVKNWKQTADAIDAISKEKIAKLIADDEEAQRTIFANLDTDAAAARLGVKLTASLTTVVKSIPQTIASAFEGGGGLAGAFKSIGVQLANAILTPLMEGLTKLQAAGVSVGASLAGAIGGSAGGGNAALVGSLAAGIGGAALKTTALGLAAKSSTVAALGLGAATLGIGLAAVGVFLLVKHFATLSKEIKEARKNAEAFQDAIVKMLTEEEIAAANGERWRAVVHKVRAAYLALGRTAEEADAAVKAMWDTDNPARSRAAILEINAALTEHQKLLEKQAEQLAKNKEDASDLVDELLQFGNENGGVPAAMRAIIEQFIALGLITDEQAAKLRGMADAGAIDFKKMQEASDLFKGRIDSLGPAFQQARLDDTAKKYINALDMLRRGGANVGGILFDAKEEISALVQESLKFGTTIPENMREWIDELLRTGQLVDENGDAITDLSKLKYGAAIKTETEIAQEGWEKLLAKIEELIARITEGLVPAITNLPSPRLPDWPNDFPVPPGTVPTPIPFTAGARAALNPALALGSAALGALGRRLPSVPILAPAAAAAGGGQELVVLVPVIARSGQDVDRAVDEVFRQFPRGFAGDRSGVRVALTKMIKESIKRG